MQGSFPFWSLQIGDRMKLPEQFTARIREQLKEEADAYFACYDQPKYQGLRVNTLKISVEEFLKISPFPLRPVPWTKNGFYYDSQYQPAKHPYYFAGLYYLQEPSAMSPAAMLPIEEGDRVLDMCAAPGGKTTELGAKLKKTGILYANDVSQSRARALLKNIELFGIDNSVVLSEPPEKLLSRCSCYFDKILIDAPCSGEGMFRKEPSIISNWEKTGTAYYAEIQRRIIVTGAKLLRPGGMMLYSTCTFSPEEDEEAIVHLLSQCPYMELVELPMFDGFDTGHGEWASRPVSNIEYCRRLWPHRIQGEGHFLALLRKKTAEEVAQEGLELNEEQQRDLLPNYGSYPYKGARLTPEAEAFFQKAGTRLDTNRLEEHEGRLYYPPKDMADVRGLRILRSGIFLGENKKKRFEPSQPYAVSLGGNCGYAISLPAEDERIVRFLKGETISLEGPDGYVLLCVDGFGLGWGKINRGICKNKYNIGWRMG